MNLVSIMLFSSSEEDVFLPKHLWIYVLWCISRDCLEIEDKTETSHLNFQYLGTLENTQLS